MGVQVEGCSMPREWGMSPLSSPRGVKLHKSCYDVCGLACDQPLPVSVPSRVDCCFRPLAGLSCINREKEERVPHDVGQFPSPRGVELHKPYRNVFMCVAVYKGCFRPLAGLSCINLGGKTRRKEKECLSFRPLAGLSCINPYQTFLYHADSLQFPSPRGVELHKPWR